MPFVAFGNIVDTKIKMFDFVKNLSPIEIGVIALILVVLFGAGLVSRLAKTSGETFKEVKKIKKTFNEALEDDSEKTSSKE